MRESRRTQIWKEWVLQKSRVGLTYTTESIESINICQRTSQWTQMRTCTSRSSQHACYQSPKNSMTRCSAHSCVFLRFHSNAIARNSIKLNINRIDCMGLFSQKRIMHGKEVAIMPKLHSCCTSTFVQYFCWQLSNNFAKYTNEWEQVRTHHFNSQER